METSSIKNRSTNKLLLTLLIGGFMTTMATSTVNLALPELIKYFRTDLTTVRWTLTAFMLATGVITPLTYYLGEKYSYKALYLTAIIGFTASSLGCALSPNIHTLIFFRILQGIFNGLVLPSAMTLIYQVFPKKKQAFAMSVISFAMTIAPAIGPTLSGGLVEYASWKAIFLINIPLGLIVILMTLSAIPSYRLAPPKGFDMPGMVTSILATALLLIGFSNASLWTWTSYKTLLFLSFGSILLVIFILRELKTPHPLLDLKVFKSNAFTASIIIRGIVTMALYSGSLLTPLFLQSAQHTGPLNSGLIMLPASVAMAITTLIIGKSYNKMNPVTLIRYGIISIGIGSYLLSRSTLNTSHIYITLSLVSRNIGIAMALSTSAMFAMASLDKKDTGSGSAINNWVAQSIGCFSLSIFTSLLNSKTQYHAAKLNESISINNELITEQALSISINEIYIISVGIIGIALILSLLFKKEQKHRNNKKLEEKVV